MADYDHDPNHIESPPVIGTLGEKSLHAALKHWYARPGDRLETRTGNYVIDLIRTDQANGDDVLVEFQTGNFAGMRRKLEALLNDGCRVHVVHPVTVARWIVKTGEDVRPLRRKSPLKNGWHSVFKELVYIPHVLAHSRFSLEVLLVHEEEIRVNDGKGSWRRKGWSIADRRLLDVIEGRTFVSPVDYVALLPDHLTEPFTTTDLAQTAKITRRLAGQMAYTLHGLGTITRTGKRGSSYLYTRQPMPD